VKIIHWTLAAALSVATMASMDLKAAGTWTNGDNITIPANIVTAGNSAVYEGLYTVQNQGQLEFRSGSDGAIIAGQQIDLKPGFKAESGSELWAMIDANFNGLSDYIESLDADGDGYFDALELFLGTSPNLSSNSYSLDFDGDGTLDIVDDIIHGGTPSSYLPVGYYPGYQGLLLGGYAAYGSIESVSVNGGLVYGWIPSLSDYFDFDFSVVITYFAFDGWGHTLRFVTEAGARYMLYCTNASGQWVACSNVINGTGLEWEGESLYLFDYLWQIPQFVALVRLGEATAEVGSAQPVNIFNSGGAEVLQEVTPEVKELDEDDQSYLIDLLYDLAGMPSGGVTAIAYPKGSTPSLANIRILGVQVGLSGSGKITVRFPFGALGDLENWTLALVYADQDPIGVNLSGHLPGPSGAAIAENQEDDPANLLLPVNDDFEERRRSNHVPQPDYNDSVIDTQVDPDYMRLHLAVSSGLSRGVVSLKYLHPNGTLYDPDLVAPLKIHTVDG